MAKRDQKTKLLRYDTKAVKTVYKPFLLPEHFQTDKI